MLRDCSLVCPDKFLVVLYNLRSRASVVHVNMEREVLELKELLETCRSELESIFRQLEEANGRVEESAARVRCSNEIAGNSRLHHGYRALRT